MIEVRISEVKMQKSDSNQTAKTARRKVQASTTLNRRYVKKPSKTTDVAIVVKKSPQVSHFSDAPVTTRQTSSKKVEQSAEKAPAHPVQLKASKRMKMWTAKQSTPQVPKMTAKELKDQAIKKALASAAKAPLQNDKQIKAQKPETKKVGKMHFGVGRIILALSCAATAVFAIVYFVNLNMPDISLRVAAMQTGIEASYPNYVPRDFSLTDITSEEGKVILNFKNTSTGDAFSLIEEQSSWDSNALLTNYVKDAYGENYSVIREQGLTLYVSGSDAAWVNGGVVYKLVTNNGSLTKKQIRSIATSL